MVHDSEPLRAADLFPHSPADQALLKSRARYLARPPGTVAEETRLQYVRFRLGASERYGIPYPYLEEILPVPDITPVPCTPPRISGVANYRGELLTILDLKQLFSVATSGPSAEAMLIVVQAGGLRVGFVVDDVEGNDDFAPSQLAARLPSAGVANMDYVLGIDQGRITLLNLAVLLADPALRVEETVA